MVVPSRASPPRRYALSQAPRRLAPGALDREERSRCLFGSALRSRRAIWRRNTPENSGAPEVLLANQPAAVSLSLSHRSEVAACAVAPSGTRLGFDLEVIEPRSQAFLEDYFTADEQQLMASATSGDRDKVVNLFWSAKESALKALDVGLRLDTRGVVVKSMAGLLCAAEAESHAPAQTESRPSLWKPFRVSFGDYIFQGWWQQSGAFLRTMVSAPACDQPVLLHTTA